MAVPSRESRTHGKVIQNFQLLLTEEGAKLPTFFYRIQCRRSMGTRSNVGGSLYPEYTILKLTGSMRITKFHHVPAEGNFVYLGLDVFDKVTRSWYIEEDSQ